MAHTARVIPLPGAAIAPVVQVLKAGRNPKKVVNLRMWHLEQRCKARAAKEDAELIASEIALILQLEEVDTRIRAARAFRLERLTKPAVTPEEKRQLAEILAEARWWRLSPKERQRIEAQRTGRGRLLAFPTGGA
jgi:DNA-binding transcriptional regulator YdaS (Cro superfamily)